MTKEDVLRQMIEDYRRKIATYETMIQEWEVELGVQSRAVSTSNSASPSTAKEAGAEPSSLVKGLQFFNKSQTEAAKAFLELVGYPLRTQQIIEGIERGGVKVGGKTAKAKKANFYTILHRSDDFGLAAKDAWGLTTWPGIKKEKDTKEGAAENGDKKE